MLKCKNCLDTGWVCESHMDKPWEGENACGCGGAGTNCTCNPDGDYEFDAVFGAVEPGNVKTWVQ